MAAVTICSDFGAQKNKSQPLFPLFPHLLAMKWWDQMAVIVVFWMLSFKLTFSLSSFAFIKRLFSSSSLSAKRVVSSVYLRLLMFLLAILIPACASSSPGFLMMSSAYKLNKQGDNIQPWCIPFPIWDQFVVPCLVLTVASWPAYRFLKRQLARVQPRQDPWGTLRMNSVGERERRHMRPALIRPSLRGGERERESEWPDLGVCRVWQSLGQCFIFYHSFYTLS